MIRTACFFFGLILLSSCGDKNKIPADVIKIDKMQAVLWDVIRAEAFTKQFIKPDSVKTAAKENLKLQQEIFAIHKITRADFYKSYDYYKSNTPLFQKMLDSMVAVAGRDRNIKTKPTQVE